MSRSRAVALLFVLLAAAAAKTGAAVSPTITFEDEAIVVSGVTPGGKVVCFSVAREISERFATIVARQAIDEDKANKGTVRFELDRKIPFQSIWVALDLATGAAAISVPSGYELRQVELPAGNLRHDAKEDTIRAERGYVEILLVRPGQGAWRGTVGDGGLDDDDGNYDGQVAASLSNLREVDGSAATAPETFAADDVVVVIDPNRMDVGLRRFAEVAK